MSKKIKVILTTIIILLMVFMVGKYMLDLLFNDLCGNDITQKVPSPDGKSVAYIFERSCGATTGSSPQLSIINKDDEFQNESGNTFRSDTDFSIEWLNDKSLRVIYNRSSETYEMNKNVNGIKIIYVGK